jgi:hypothetical protein
VKFSHPVGAGTTGMEWEAAEGPRRPRSLALKKLRVRKLNTSGHACQDVASRSVSGRVGELPGCAGRAGAQGGDVCSDAGRRGWSPHSGRRRGRCSQSP